MRMRPVLTLLSMATVLALTACGEAGDATTDSAGDESDSTTNNEDTGNETETGNETGIEEPDPNVDWPTLDCDPLVPSFCGYPWPNNVFTTADDSYPTGRHLVFSEAMLPVHTGKPHNVEPFEDVDGFSPAGFILTHMPGATRNGVATDQTIERSLEADSPTVIIDAETGEWIPHFVDIDSTADSDDQRSFMLFPTRRLQDDHRYIVAIRNVVDGDGSALTPSPAFLALRDLVAVDDPEIEESVESRRPLYADIFMRLGDAGVERGELQLAWDFTTQSTEDQTGELVHMRDEALDMGPFEYVIDEVEMDVDPENILARITGHMTVPLYTDQEAWGGELNYGDDGMPEPTGMHDVEWQLLIPNSAMMEPAPIVQYGHGLFGKFTQINSSHFRSWMNEYNYAFFAVDWKGMAEGDDLQAAFILDQGDIGEFRFMMDRMQQGVLNALLSMNMMRDSFSQDPNWGAYLDPDTRYYHGISQGGILGGVYMALTTEVTRGALGVPGQPYNLLLPRSVDFNQFFDIAKVRIKDGRDMMLTLGMIQLLWNRAEPTGYTNHIRGEDLLPNTDEHEVLIRAAIGDHQVTTLGAHHMARSMDATHLDTGIRSIFELETVDEGDGAVYVEYEFGLPPDPVCNLPQYACEDPHGKLRKLESARQQLDAFFRTGVIKNYCDGGECSYPDMSGCGGEDPTPPCSEQG